MHKGGEYPKPCDDIASETDFYYPDWDLSDDNSKVIASFRKVSGKHSSKEASLSIVKAGLAHLTKEAAIAHAKVIYQIED